jgi:hypothetical protein
MKKFSILAIIARVAEPPLSPFLSAPLFFASRFTDGTSECFNLVARIHED